VRPGGGDDAGERLAFRLDGRGLAGACAAVERTGERGCRVVVGWRRVGLSAERSK
jgi:hypothetical protein